jgi:hypothetical protein
MMRNKRLAALFASVAAMFVVGSLFASGASAAEENVCPDGVDGWTKIDDVPGETQTTYDLSPVGSLVTNAPSTGRVTVYLPTGWTADICVKGAQERVWEYGLGNGASTSTAVTTSSGNPADVSHVSYRLYEPELSEWCSPGFWRNNIGAWAATGYSPTSIDSVTGISFGTILANPKMYARTGDYERIADILSDAHPDIDYSGERTPDSCPLAADEARTQASTESFILSADQPKGKKAQARSFKGKGKARAKATKRR